ncbi:MAG: histidine kinase N-terminal 7TM domain-containing diguanylate cyclase [Actinomycetota bacterium]
MQLNVFSASLMAATLISGLLAYFTWKRRPANASTELFFILAAITTWSFFAVLEAMARTVPYKTLFSVLTYLGITAVPVLFLIFACRYTHMDGWLTKKSIPFLFIVPIVTLAVASTNHAHGLLWASVSLGQNDLAGTYGIYTRGPWFWVNAVYCYLMILAAMMVLLVGMLRFRHVYRIHSRMLILYSTFPLFANLVYVFLPQALSGLEITPVTFTISGILMFFALFHYRLLDLSPFAWETIIESLDDGVLLFNNHNLVVDFNQPFTDFAGIKKLKAGTPLPAVLREYPQVSRFIEEERSKRAEISAAKGGIQYFYQLECSPVYDRRHKDRIGKILIIKDITREKLDQQKIRLSEEKFRTLFEHSMDGIFITTPQGRYIDVNTSLASMLGYSREELLEARGEEDLYFPEQKPLRNQRGATFETRLMKKDGTAIEAEISYRVIYEGASPKYCQGIVRDITQRKKAENQLRYLSFHDSLTGLYNRHYFEEEVKRINKALKRFSPVSIISMDINNLKEINDRHGHQEGDLLLKLTAKILTSLIRKEDILARTGGDEFCAILPRTPLETAKGRKEKMMKKIREYNRKDKKPAISIAIGISSTQFNEISINGAIRRADNLMYTHKREMKSGQLYFSASGEIHNA